MRRRRATGHTNTQASARGRRRATIAENSAVDGGVVASQMLESVGNIGFDASRRQYVDLIETGIVDPTKVVRIAPQSAVSVARALLLTEATMTEKPEPKKGGVHARETERSRTGYYKLGPSRIIVDSGGMGRPTRLVCG